MIRLILIGFVKRHFIVLNITQVDISFETKTNNASCFSLRMKNFLAVAWGFNLGLIYVFLLVLLGVKMLRRYLHCIN